MLKLRSKLFQKVLSGVLIVTMLFASATTVFAFEEFDSFSDTQEDMELNDQKYQESYDQMIEDELNGGNANARSVDSMLLVSQKWLNETYSSKPGFGSVPEDGTSRRATINGLIRALQLELGITQTADNFGAGTIAKFNQYYPNGISQQSDGATDESNVYGIIQCALWTKGYSTNSGTITKHFYDGTGNAIRNLKEDMGFSNSDSKVNLSIMKSLLSMDYYVTVSGGSDQIRQIQQELNRKYPSYLGIIPCDGYYGRAMNKSLIIVLQAIEGYSVANATGNFGSGTQAKLPLDFHNTGSWTGQLEKYTSCIKLIQYALCCNGYGATIDLNNTVWNKNLSDVIWLFQNDMNISVTGNMDVNTWMSLLLSKGNPDRPSTACDTRFEMTQERIDYLKANGYETVGRYLTGSSKGLKDDEPQRIIKSGLSFFPIFQETTFDTVISDYNYKLGISDAQKAVERASQLGIPQDSIIYFAIDLDPQNNEISQYVIPYFEAIKSNIAQYKVGIYGTRNTCTQIMNLGYAETCFVSDMSTAYSGNMGFKMPTNWNLDQFNEIVVTTASGNWDLDKVSYSSRFPTVSKLTKYVLPSFNLNGEHIGEEFAIPSGAKKIKYTVFFDALGNERRLEVMLMKHAYSPDEGINEYQLVSNSILNSYEFNEESSDWCNVSDLLGYRFSYRCSDLSKPIYPPYEPGSETNPTYEDGNCSVTIMLEYQY